MQRRIFGSYLIVSCRDSTELFEPIEHPLDAVSILVGSKLAGWRVLPVSFRRNDGSEPMDRRPLFNQDNPALRPSQRRYQSGRDRADFDLDVEIGL